MTAADPVTPPGSGAGAPDGTADAPTGSSVCHGVLDLDGLSERADRALASLNTGTVDAWLLRNVILTHQSLIAELRRLRGDR